jgi:Tol biopolymer transport system component
MSDQPSPGPLPSHSGPPNDRLDSWKEIAAYLNRDVTTVQRWEKREGMPVHRHIHDKIGSVYGFQSEIDAWARSRNLGAADAGLEPQPTTAELPARKLAERRRWWTRARTGVIALTLVAAAITIGQLQSRDALWKNPIADARFTKVTDFRGAEEAAAVSRDGRFVAFLSDRDGRVDVWVTQVGTGQFYNVTRNDPREFINPSVRTLGFSPDGSLVTFWVRKPDGPSASNIGIWDMPILGGPLRPYLEGAAEFDWSADGARLVYHTTGPGDPMFVKSAGDTGSGRQIFSAPSGLHSHFLVWSRDGQFIYFVQGSLPNRLDIWRIRPDGGSPERITHHEADVSYPVFVDSHTLMYLAGDGNGDGPWLHSIDVERRVAHRLTSGIDRYTSLAASADGQHLVVTQASPQGSLWRVPIADSVVDMSTVKRIPLSTTTGFCPRMGPGYLVYVSSKGMGESIWKSQGDAATEIWSAAGARIIGCPAIAPGGGRVTFAMKQNGQSLLYVVNLDGTAARVVERSLELTGSPTWSPDGRSITVAANDNGTPHLFRANLDESPPVPILRQPSVDPVWSPDGRYVVFSGPDVGTTFSISAVGADGQAYPLPRLTLTRGSRRLIFLPGRQALVVLRGGIQHKDLGLVELATGTERQLTNFAADFDVVDFDISPDGREAVVQQQHDQSDIVMIETAQR